MAQVSQKKNSLTRRKFYVNKRIFEQMNGIWLTIFMWEFKKKFFFLGTIFSICEILFQRFWKFFEKKISKRFTQQLWKKNIYIIT